MSNNIPVNGWPQLKDLEAVQPTLDRLDKIEAWKRTVKEETFTGEEITIPNALALPARSLITEINATQDLHGLPFPYVGGSQKNKYNISALNNSSSAAGITSTVNSDGTLSLTAGTASDEFVSALSYQTANEPIPFTAGETYTFSIGTNKKQASLVLQVLYRETSSSGWTTLVNVQDVDSANFTMPSGTIYDLLIRLKVAAGNSITATTLYPMVCKSTESADWMPYSNICPISGRDSVAINQTGLNQFNPDSSSAETIDITGTGTIRYGHTFGSGTYTLINKGTGLTSYYYRMPKKDMTDRGTSIQINNNTSVNVTVDDNHLLWVFTSDSGLTDANKIAVEMGTNELFVPYQHSSATIQLGTTVYGADINWDTGVMTVDRIILTNFESANIIEGAGSTSDWLNIRYVITGSGVLNGNIGTNQPIIIAKQKNNYSGDWQFANANDTLHYYNSDGFITAFYPKSIFADLATFKTYEASNRAQFVLPLATPTTIQLTPEQLEMLKGYNHITLSDGYGTIELKALTGANWS